MITMIITKTLNTLIDTMIKTKPRITRGIYNNKREELINEGFKKKREISSI